MLTILEEFPLGLIDIPSTEIHRHLKGPTLIHLPGRRPQPLFVSVLLHGNEPTGWMAVQKLLQKYQGQELPRALSIFIGNIQAAKQQKRRLDEQPDYNRIWQGEGSPEHQMMQRVLSEMKQRGVFASIDIHNNTGVNPHYACINRVDHRFFHLAGLFSRTVVYFIRPQGVQTMAFAELCPAVTVECGHVGEETGVNHAFEFIEATLHLLEIPETPVHAQDLGLFHTVATVQLPEGTRFGFGEEDAPVRFVQNLDHLNFNEIPPRTLIGKFASEQPFQFIVTNEAGENVQDRYFEFKHGEIRTRVPVMPSMFTLDKDVIRQDVFGYLMERMELPSQ